MNEETTQITIRWRW